MALRIRLRRVGGNNKLSFRIVVCDSRRPNEGRYIENVGWYDPRMKQKDYELKLERMEYWIGKGAQVTGTVRNLMKKARKKAAAAPAAKPAA
jgi:small subunit ribosomal protein S16